MSAERMRAIRRRIERPMSDAVRTFYVGQAARVTDRLLGRRKALPPSSELLPSSEDQALFAAIDIYYQRGIIAAVDFAAQQVGMEPQMYSPIVQRELARAGERIVDINDTTRRAVAEMLQEADMRGYNLYQIATGVPEEDFPGLRATVEELYQGRAETIARTELAYATQHAAHDDWRQSGVQWVAIDDGVDFDAECADRNGTTVSVEEDVEPNHPRCTVVSTAVTEPP